MKRLTLLTVLMSSLLAPKISAEDAPSRVMPAFNAPVAGAAQAPTPAGAVAPAAAVPAAPAAQSTGPTAQEINDQMNGLAANMPAASDPDTFGSGALASTMSGGLTFAQMGNPQGITLSGGQMMGGANFTLPGDQVVTMAQLTLDVQVSPEMASRNATLQLMLNGQLLGSVPLGAGDPDVSRYQLDVPAALMVSANNLSFKINDGQQQQCLRDNNGKYQIRILPASRFSWEGQQLNVESDLSHLPRPFFDSMQMTPASISVSFPAALGSDTLSAAALVASWMGIQADYRGVTFDTLRDRLPEKNGIVFGHPGQQVGGVTLPLTTRPLLQIIDNPANPTYKLLLVVGNNDSELRAAAWRLTRGGFEPQTARIATDVSGIPVSKPYDAPRWIPTDRPVKISELLRKDQSMTVNGIWHEPLQVAFRAAPDLHLWDGETIPLHIGYRFPSETWINEQASQLTATLNNNFLRNLPMNKQGLLESLWHRLGGDARQEQFTIPLEPYMIYGDNQLQLYFNVVPKDNAPCSVLLNSNIKSWVTDESTIDLSDTRHFSLLPNLSYFVGASFPFSRLADFSQTVLMLPEQPSDVQVSTLLNLAARSGNSTGTVLGHNQVVMGVPSGGANLSYLRGRDILAVTGLDQRQFNQSLLADSPYSVSESTLGVRPLTLWQEITSWLLGDWAINGIDADRYFSSNNAWRGFVSYRSPWNSERVVVAAIASSDDQLQRLSGDLASSRINAGIRGDTAIITNENGVRSFRVSRQFPSGQLPWYMMPLWYANQHSGLLAILALLVIAILGFAMTAMFKRHAHNRLNPRGDK